MGLFSSYKQDSDSIEYVALPTLGNATPKRRLSSTPRKTRWIMFGIFGSSLLALAFVLIQDPGKHLDATVETEVISKIAAASESKAIVTTSTIAAISTTSSVSPISSPSSSPPTNNAQAENQTAQPDLDSPILGSAEDPIHFYYPRLSTDKPFHPSPVPHNIPPTPRPRTPLFIAFTRNNEMLVQTVLSYIAAGWPPQDIVVIDNSGTMDANPSSLLSVSNPFFLDYDRLRGQLGVSVMQTPTLLSFAQLMNFYLRVAMARGWETFFWSHMDVVVLSDEGAVPYKSFYQNVLDVLQETLEVSSSVDANSTMETKSVPWAARFFNYDYLTLVNVEAWRKIGQWDTFIPYYASDCDAYSRMYLSGLESPDRVKVSAGRIYDIVDVIPDLENKLFASRSGDSFETHKLNGPVYQALAWELEKNQRFKQSDQASHRNSWQGRKHGGKGEPWTYVDFDGFERAWWLTAKSGQEIYEKKWGTRECNMADIKDWNVDRAWKAHTSSGWR